MFAEIFAKKLHQKLYDFYFFKLWYLINILKEYKRDDGCAVRG
jgi:hypothetical protein